MVELPNNNDKVLEVIILLAKLTHQQGDDVAANDYLKQCFSLARKYDTLVKFPELIPALAIFVADAGKYRAAMQLLGVVAKQYVTSERMASPLEQELITQLTSRLIAKMGETEFQTAYTEGERMTVEQIYRYNSDLLDTTQRGAELCYLPTR